MTDSIDRPLWEVMHCAYSPHREPGQWRLGYAAEIRALVEAKLPKEPPIDLLKLDMKGTDRIANFARVIQRDERQRLRLDMLAEADRAEAGE